jgi:putative transcriptional regulator
LVPDIDANFKIYNGGPVEQDNLYFIHNIPELITNSVEISNGIFWGGDFELTKSLINEGQVKKDNIRFFLRLYWLGSQQLENEMESNSWILLKISMKIKSSANLPLIFGKKKY